MKKFTTEELFGVDGTFRDFPFIVAANPSSIFPAKKAYHYKFLKVLWHLDLVSLSAIRKCADALQERTTTR